MKKTALGRAWRDVGSEMYISDRCWRRLEGLAVLAMISGGSGTGGDWRCWRGMAVLAVLGVIGGAGGDWLCWRCWR